jgi:hypothetical protein
LAGRFLGLVKNVAKNKIKAQIKALERKEREFIKKFEFDRATHARIVRQFLEDYVIDKK